MRSRQTWLRFDTCATMWLCALASHAHAAPLAPPPPGVQTVEHYGIEFSVVGDPGNPAYVGDPGSGNNGRGGVASQYAIARTQVTNAQWLAFANAYRPHITGNPIIFGLAEGQYFYYDTGTDRYAIAPGFENHAASMSWRMAARYCNWLHNDQRTDLAAFVSGAYDTTTFTPATGFPFNDQLTHSPGARFYLPSRDEWVKAAYWDPSRFGAGQGGYWQYPNRTDRPLIPGTPTNGGETPAGQDIGTIPFADLLHPVAAYTQVQSPWGLFDLSGGGIDWTEDAGGRIVRFTQGTHYLEPFPEREDAIWHPGATGGFPHDSFAGAGTRVAMYIPGSGAAWLLMPCALLLRRNRKPWSACSSSRLSHWPSARARHPAEQAHTASRWFSPMREVAP